MDKTAQAVRGLPRQHREGTGVPPDHGPRRQPRELPRLQDRASVLAAGRVRGVHTTRRLPGRVRRSSRLRRSTRQRRDRRRRVHRGVLARVVRTRVLLDANAGLRQVPANDDDAGPREVGGSQRFHPPLSPEIRVAVLQHCDQRVRLCAPVVLVLHPDERQHPDADFPRRVDDRDGCDQGYLGVHGPVHPERSRECFFRHRFRYHRFHRHLRAVLRADDFHGSSHGGRVHH
mmetsp:Transcript_8426/g.38333  ORF Transcript_8426/g.38333 Transcript_8426/m.38333 type:complete len:231 (+) Transcript_8426:2131-2823(+)